jgi:hypothetical protein
VVANGSITRISAVNKYIMLEANRMARKKGSRISEESRRGLSDGRFKDPWKGAKQKEKTLFKKIRKESGW